jgi:hypothetical protein
VYLRASCSAYSLSLEQRSLPQSLVGDALKQAPGRADAIKNETRCVSKSSVIRAANSKLKPG